MSRMTIAVDLSTSWEISVPHADLIGEATFRDFPDKYLAIVKAIDFVETALASLRAVPSKAVAEVIERVVGDEDFESMSILIDWDR